MFPYKVTTLTEPGCASCQKQLLQASKALEAGCANTATEMLLDVDTNLKAPALKVVVMLRPHALKYQYIRTERATLSVALWSSKGDLRDSFVNHPGEIWPKASGSSPLPHAEIK